MADYDASKWREVFRLSSAKLGVALAVIKSKPVGKSGRQHAEDLAVRFKQQQENWKSKAEDLKEEVLSLKQELLLSKLLRKQQNGAETARGEDIVKLFSQDLPEAQLSENDSGCDTQTLSLTPDPVDAVLSSKVVPPRSLRPSQASFLRDARDRALAKHTRFLHNLCTLRRSEKNTQADGGDAVLEDTALNMIQSLVEAHREAGGGSTGDMSQLDRFVQASQLVVQALEGGGVGRRKVLEKAEELLEELLELLLNNSQLNKEVPEGQQPQQVDWVRYDNSFYLFWILEQLLQARSCSTGSEHHHHLQLSQLEKHILPLSDEFPLFALYMWRIEGLLKPACTRGT
ncbi:meiosis-specific protein MEI4 isoform X2 [Tachysurus fulvidraco]|uniref:meiosis-specific protein MEI4 isoform X2 n=1 Tax=Tachysurus fulvidraco TaxID=1234273 RepID=UPI001FEE0C2B|nr:meiosis-specific protein MEI4 isoform X2 [Tachysurus fulvidraco]